MSGFISANLQRRCSSYCLDCRHFFSHYYLSTYALAQDEDATIEAGMIESGLTRLMLVMFCRCKSGMSRRLVPSSFL